MLQCASGTSGPPAPISRLALSGCPSGSQVVWVCALECNVNIAFPHSRFGVQCRYHRHVAQRCAVVWGVGISSLRDLVGSGHQARALACGMWHNGVQLFGWVGDMQLGALMEVRLCGFALWSAMSISHSLIPALECNVDIAMTCGTTVRTCLGCWDIHFA